MDPVTQLITAWKIPIGAWGKDFFTFLTTNFRWFFNGIAKSITYALEGLIDLILFVPPVITVLAIALLAFYLQRSWKLAVAVAIGLLFIINLGFWKETIETLVLVIASAGVSMAIGVPVGIAVAHRAWLFKLLRPVLDLMQTMPTFVYLIPVLVLFGLGLAPGLIATVIFAVPAPVRLTHLGITSVPKQLLEAGEAFGATKRQLLWKVELPAALPTIMAGLTQCIMLCLSMVVIAALVGADGLGKPVVRALGQANIPLGLESGLAIVVLAIILDRVCRVGEKESVMTAAVEFKNVDIVFGEREAEGLKLLDQGASRSEILEKTGAVLGCAGASLAVKEGEISVLMGLSGSGKSTLLRAVNGLNKVSRGEVIVNDNGKPVDVVTCSPETLRRLRQNRVAMVFQQFGLLPWRTVAENVGFGLELAGMAEAERDERVTKQLKLVGLDQWSKKYGHELSGGMQQRVGLARAFATEAPILLMDEPFSALDPLIRTKLQDELLSLQKTLKKTIVFVSHDLEEALKLGNYISILEGGRIVQTGRPEDIVLRPANDYVREFIANVNPLSVLTAYNVMRDARDLEEAGEDWVWLDRRRTTRFKIGPDRKVVAAERDKQKATWVACSEAEKPVGVGERPVFWATPGTSLRTVMLAMHRADTAPVALFDETERFVGAIGVRDVLQAVLRRKPD